MGLAGWAVAASLAYLAVLFAIARFGDRRADSGRSLIARPHVYALSLAVYATSWTFYGSVGRAAESGLDFLPVYLGPTLAAMLWWIVLRKMIRIAKTWRITTIADFIGARYGKSSALAGIVTVVAVIGCIPYIALQLKAVSSSYGVIRDYPHLQSAAAAAVPPVAVDTAFYVALFLAAFSVLFGTRHLDATERHEGMVAAVAFESIVKLVAFVSVGLFVVYGLHDGFTDLSARVAASREVLPAYSIGGAPGGYVSWAALTLLSMLAITVLPRQFQVAVVENVDERHVATAAWLFPLYLLVINVFVLPIALAGLMAFPGGRVDADTFMLALPLAGGQPWVAVLAMIGGLSAATGMVIVETVALSTMVCNDLVVPIAVRLGGVRATARRDMTGFLLATRRVAIVAIVMLGYAYERAAGGTYALVSIGLTAFAGVAQFAPSLLGGLFWRQASRGGALSGLCAGVALWTYTLLLPAFARSGWIAPDFVDHGPFGIEWLRPTALFGSGSMDEISHALFWSLGCNLLLYVAVSLSDRQGVEERIQAARFVDVFRTSSGSVDPPHGHASVEVLRALVGRFLGTERAELAFAEFEQRSSLASSAEGPAHGGVVQFAETLLGGTIGSATSRVMVASVVDRGPVGLDAVINIADEASQIIAYSHRLEEKSRELEEATRELEVANARLEEVDRLKDDFIPTVTHELRTPLTSIRALSEILRDNPDLAVPRRAHYLAIIVKESERLTRLINQVLDVAKIESGNAQWRIEEVDLTQVIEDAANASAQMFEERRIALRLDLPGSMPAVRADRDRLEQVVLNLLSNAAKFCEPVEGRVEVSLCCGNGTVEVEVRDNGPGVSEADRDLIFEKFHQAGHAMRGKPKGTGLGLPISRRIVEHFGGRLWLVPGTARGAVFRFELPYDAADPGEQGAAGSHLQAV